MRRKILVCLACGYLTFLGCALARADFVVDPAPSGDKFFIDLANKDVTSFTGEVANPHSGPVVNVSTVGAVNTGSGFATIKPVKGGSLTSLTFTPVDGN